MRVRGKTRIESTVIVIAFTMLILILTYGSIQFIATSGNVDESVIFAVFYGGVGFFSLVGVFLFHRIQEAKKDAELIAANNKQLELQKQALDALREQRHDMLNELALVYSYIQLGRLDDAIKCLEFASANLSDKYNYRTLPDDAWFTVITHKQQEARSRRIDFKLEISGDPPTDINEQRLLPRLIGNLIDNAFDAVAEMAQPHVALSWESRGDRRILSVENNGPPIPQAIMDKLFEPGFTSKGEEGHGWGLCICQRIAEELGGKLVCRSEKDSTNFSLILPTRSQDAPIENTA